MIAEMSTLTQPSMLTVEEIARRLNTTSHVVNRLIRDGLLTGYKVGREWRVDPTDFEEFLQRNKRPKK
jgi:putative molybdopterin biosynthesis protein